MNYRNHALVLTIIERLLNHGSKAGKTHVQKAMFLVQMTQMQNFSSAEPFKFVLYKHGPYSFDLESTMEDMFVYDAIHSEIMINHGIALIPSGNADFLKKVAPLNSEEKEASEDVCRFIGKSDVRQLEKWATVVWIRCAEGVKESESIARRLHALKPHVSIEDAIVANNEVNKLLKAS